MAPQRLIKHIESHTVGSITLIYVIIGLLIVGGFFYFENLNNNNKKLVKQNGHLIRENQHRIKEIQGLINQGKIRDYNGCIAIRNINVLITQSLKRSKRNLSKVSYYRTHPRELKFQKKQIDAQLRAFKPRTCMKLKPSKS